ncbi:MAG: T9SS type A sorting domain-containing protein [Ignavibacteria bacterium]|nr:T9SS type A sorting domain-containing protein [Ignavibacteria bacterium]
MNKNPQYQQILTLKLKFIAFLVFSLIFCHSLISQSITWQRTYHVYQNDFGYKILPAPGNCFYFCGYVDNIITSYSYVIKIDQQGDTLWSRKITGGLYTAALSSDSSCVLANLGDSLSVVKINSAGNILWNKMLPVGFLCWDMKRIYDNGFILCGNSGLKAFAVRIDSVGNFIWQKIFAGSSTKGFYSVIESNQTGFVFTGYNQDPDTTKIYVVKLDYDGNLVWEKNYIASNNRNSGQKICHFKNTYLIGGNTDINIDEKTFILKIDTSGNLLQTKIWIPYGTSKEFFDDMSALNTNKIVLTKRVDSSSTLYTYAKAQLIDSNFNLLREQVYFPSYSYAIFSSILPLPNRDILFAGTFDYFSNWSSHRYDLYAVRTDSNLNTSAFPPIGIAGNNQNLPEKFALNQNFPNPFNPTTTIKYEIPKDAEITIKVYDLLGREVFSINEYKKAGGYEVKFDGSNLASGMYFYQIETDGFTDTKKMVLLK